MLRIRTPLDAALEDLIHRTIGCCIAVHKEFGPGLVELAYGRAVAHELAANQIPFEQEKRVPITYRGRYIYVHRLDIVVGDQILVELKAVDRIQPVHHAQALSALRISGLKVGLLINFNVPVLPEGIRRIVP